jgi:hypothetical protein
MKLTIFFPILTSGLNTTSLVNSGNKRDFKASKGCDFQISKLGETVKLPAKNPPKMSILAITLILINFWIKCSEGAGK